MDENVKELQGSPTRDIFKRKHKNGDRKFYACDIDFCLVNSSRIIAFLDTKGKYDKVTWSESIAYKDLLKIAPVYIIYVGDGILCEGPFSIYKYIDGYKESTRQTMIAVRENWNELFEWERSIRLATPPARLELSAAGRGDVSIE